MWRPQEGQIRLRRFSSSACFFSPENVIVQATAIARAANVTSCGSSVIGRRPLQSRTPARMWVRSKVQLAASPIGYVRIELGGREVGVTQHLLNAPQVGAALEQVRRERVAQQVGVDALGVEPGLRREASQDQEGAGAGERTPARVEEELGAVAPVEMRPAPRDVAAQRVDGRTAQRDEPLLRPLSERAHD